MLITNCVYCDAPTDDWDECPWCGWHQAFVPPGYVFGKKDYEQNQIMKANREKWKNKSAIGWAFLILAISIVAAVMINLCLN